MSQAEAIFLDFSCRKLDQMAGRIVTCLELLSEAQIWTRSNESSNTIGNLVLHLAGNVRQWLIAGVGGEPDIRERDFEFAARHLSRGELKQVIESTVQEAIVTLRELRFEGLTKTLAIQGFQLTALEAIYHAVEHFSGHTAQIILLAKAHRDQPFDFYRYLSGAHAQETP